MGNKLIDFFRKQRNGFMYFICMLKFFLFKLEKGICRECYQIWKDKNLILRLIVIVLVGNMLRVLILN